MRSIKNSYHLYAGITIFGWGLAFVLTKYALTFIQDTTLGFLRNVIASLMLIGVIYWMRISRFEKKDLLLFVLSGLSGFFMFLLTFNKGAHHVTAATSSVVMATVPIFTALMASILYGEKLKWLQWLSILLQFFGMFVLTQGQGGLSANKGIIWLLMAALSLSTYNIFQRRLTKKYTSMQVSVYSILLGTIPFLIFTPSVMLDLPRFTPLVWTSVILMGILSSAIAYVSWAKAFSLAEKTSQVSNYMFVTPILATIFGMILLKEYPDIYFLIGAGIIFVGLIVFNKSELILRTFQKN